MSHLGSVLSKGVIHASHSQDLGEVFLPPETVHLAIFADIFQKNNHFSARKPVEKLNCPAPSTPLTHSKSSLKHS